ncbi:C40 family peptidase [Kocuria soli]|uniref:C40 family peptidase n=1 Tax=Kocuria soli TaxID=2485125 RepID=UPI001F2EA82A|nr:C40 family peptidase [Kocuria soli]
MQNVKTVARRTGLGIAVAGVAAAATIAPASAMPELSYTGTLPTSFDGVDYSAAEANGWSFSWTLDANGNPTYNYGNGASSAPAAASNAAPAAQASSSDAAPAAASNAAPVAQASSNEAAPASASYEAPAAQASSSNEAPAAQASSGVSTQSTGSGSTSGIAGAAQGYVGSGYVYGGTTPGAWDCSGFTQYVYAQQGIELPRTAAAQGAAGTPTSNPQPGDLVIQNGGSHVGIYLGNGQMISALNPSQGTQVHSVNAMSVDSYVTF